MNEIIDFSDLLDLFRVQGLSTTVIAQMKGCHSATIRRHLKKLGITLKAVIDWSDLKELYIGQKLSVAQVAVKKGCDRRVVRKQLKLLGIPRRDKSQGQLASWRSERKRRTDLDVMNNPEWKGGQPHKDTLGYITVWCPSHPYAHHGRVYEHRLVVEKRLGRFLHSWEIVHHIDGIRYHNDDSNLELLASQADHMPSIAIVRTLNRFEKELVYLRGERRHLLLENKTLRAALQGKLYEPEVKL